MNNKGQALVVFILFIPIIIILLSIVTDLGDKTYNKEKTLIDVKHALKNDSKEELSKIENIEVSENNNYITVYIKDYNITYQKNKETKEIKRVN